MTPNTDPVRAREILAHVIATEESKGYAGRFGDEQRHVPEWVALEAIESALASAREPDGYTSYGEFRWACDCDDRMKREWTPVYLAPPSAPVGVADEARRLYAMAFNAIAEDGSQEAEEACIRAIEAALNATPPPADAEVRVCKWYQQDEGYDTFSTSCGHEYSVNDCTDGNVQLPFCPFCARPLQGIAWSIDDEEKLPAAPSGEAIDAAVADALRHGTGAIRVEHVPHADLAAPQQPAGVDETWRQKAAAWLEAKAVEQEANNQRWPDHAAAYKEWRDRPGVLRYLAAQVLAAQQQGGAK